MFLIETSNEKEQAQLDEEFHRQDNYFAIPIKQVSQVSTFVDAIIYEFFPKYSRKTINPNTSLEHNLDELIQNPLVKKIKSLVQNSLRMTISLSNLREVFEIIRKLYEKIEYYQKYFLKLDDILEDDDQVKYGSRYRAQLQSLESMFAQDFNYQASTVLSLENDLNYKVKLFKLQESPQNKHKKTSLQHIPQKQEQNNNQQQVNNSVQIQKQPETRHSLKMQVVSGSNFSTLNDIFNQKFDRSFESNSQTDQSLNSIHDVKKEFAYDSATNSTLYSPEWKILDQMKKKNIKEVLGVEDKKEASSQFLNNLSGKFNPVPSVLNDESLNKVARRQKREDIKKSKFLFETILDNEPKQELDEKMYNNNLRSMKIQQKMRKKSPSTGQNFRKIVKSPEAISSKKQQTSLINAKEKPENGLLSSLFRFKKKKNDEKPINTLIE